MAINDHPSPQGLTAQEKLALKQLRIRYRQDRDYFSQQELAQLRFLRWLRETERAQS